MSSKQEPVATEPFTTTRRGFVKVGAAAMFFASVPAGATEVARALAGNAGARTILSIGYWDGLFRGDSTESPTSHVLPATALKSDAAFTHASAEITVHGFWRAPQNRFTRTSISVIGLYPQTIGSEAPFVGWNSAMSKSGLSSTRKSRFIVPVDSQGNLSLAVDRVVDGGRRRAVASSPFATTDYDQIKALASDASSIMKLGPSSPLGLQKGIYFVALRDRDGAEVPDWSHLKATSLFSRDHLDPDGASVLVQWDGMSEVSFDYVVLGIAPNGVASN